MYDHIQQTSQIVENEDNGYKNWEGVLENHVVQ